MELQQQWHRFRSKVEFWFCRRRLQQVAARNSPEYRRYLEIQLRRTLSKKNEPLIARAMKLIDRIAELVDLGKCDVLCVGCRNVAELDYFRGKGVHSVIGIDLFSESQDILVMDMHHMIFPDNHFDVIYCSHSLEHAYDVHQAVNEIIRVARPGALVAIEVPVQYETRGADLIDFGNLQGLHAAFEPHIQRVLWSDEHSSHSAWNDSGNEVVRTVFTIHKINRAFSLQ